MSNFRIIYNGEELDFSSIQKDEIEDSYLKDITNFYKEWINEKDYIIAKTSGSTGEPKRIQLSKKSMLASARATGLYFGFKPQSVLYCPLPIQFIAGKMMLVRAYQYQAKLIISQPSKDPLRDVDAPIDFMVMTPHQLQEAILSNSIKNLKYVESLLLGGSPIHKKLLVEIENLKTRVYIGYGMTETMSHVAVRRLNGHLKSNVYEAVPGVKFSIGEDHCLIIHSPHLQIDAMRTNDIIDLQDEHHFIWKGRRDFVVNSGGIKLHPERIEEKLSSIIKEPFFLSKEKDEVLGERLVIFIESQQSKEELIEQYQEAMFKQLVKHERPKNWHILPSLPRTKNGKWKR